MLAATLAKPFIRSAFDLRQAVRHTSAGNAIDTSALDRVLYLDETAGLVEVQAGARWAKLGMTVREAIEQNAPDTEGKPAGAYVESFALVTLDGEMRRVSRESSPELFALTLGGQGLFGALYSATLRSGWSGEALPPESAISEERFELLVPPSEAEYLLAEVQGRSAAWRIPIESVEVRPTLPDADGLLRWAKRSYTAIGLDFRPPAGIGGRVRARQLRRELIDVALSRGGSFPIATTWDATCEHVEACYPELKVFIAEKRRYDPGEKLVNRWYRHYRDLLCRQHFKVSWCG